MIEANPPVQPRRQWLMYDCPFCGHRMAGTRQRATVDGNNQEYIKTVYACQVCDYWMITEIPRKIAATIVDEKCLPPVGQSSEKHCATERDRRMLQRNSA